MLLLLLLLVWRWWGCWSKGPSAKSTVLASRDSWTMEQVLRARAAAAVERQGLLQGLLCEQGLLLLSSSSSLPGLLLLHPAGSLRQASCLLPGPMTAVQA
jgi:hypothetical protein